MTATRSVVSCVIFGSLCELLENMLLTYRTIMKLYNFVEQQIKEDVNGKDPSLFETLSQVSSVIELL